MKNNRTYHLFLLLSTFTRGLVETFSLVLLYNKGFEMREILVFLLIMYLLGILINYFSLKFNYKVMLIISSIFFGTSYLYLSGNDISIFLLAIFLSLSNYSYHSIRHYLGLVMLKKRDARLLVNIMNIGMILSSIFGVLIISKLPLIIVSIILIVLIALSLLPIFKLKINPPKGDRKVIISKRKIIFNILDQFKVIFMELQPLFLYLYVNDSIVYVGIFNIVISIASLIVVYFISSKLDRGNYFRYITLLLGVVLFLKINVKSSMVLLIIAFFEGIFVKLYDGYSLSYLYDIKDIDIKKYLIMEETIFFISKSIIMFLFIGFNLNLKLILLISIVGIIFSGLFYEEKSA